MTEYPIGERIKDRRNQLKLTLKDLSEQSGLSPQLISDYENGRKEPGVKNIKILCKALKIYPNYLLCEDRWDVEKSKIDTYGNILHHYIEALGLSKQDELVVNIESREVYIRINDDVIKNALIQIEKFKGMGEIEETVKNFNVNILSSVDLDK